MKAADMPSAWQHCRGKGSQRDEEEGGFGRVLPQRAGQRNSKDLLL